jgi:hypothetical protein
MTAPFEVLADEITTGLPDGPRVVVIGSTSFWHTDSEATCLMLGRLLAAIPRLVLITGGVEGVGETVGRSFSQARLSAGQEPHVYHVLPADEPAWDYGVTLCAGADMAERREVLARLADLYLAIEGGPGTVHEAAVARSRDAVVLPLGRSGGHALGLYNEMECPAWLDAATWAMLGARGATPDDAATALVQAIQAFWSR